MVEFNFLDKAYFVLGIGGKTAIQQWNIDNYVQVLKNIKKESAKTPKEKKAEKRLKKSK